VWLDAESWGYVSSLRGRLALAVSLPGSDPGSAPVSIDSAAVPPETAIGAGGVVRMTPLEQQRIGFRAAREMLMVRVRGRSVGDWVVFVAEDPARPLDANEIAAYAEELARALDELAAIESSRLNWAMLQHLLPATASLSSAAENALAELAGAIGGSAALAVASHDGRRVVMIGDATAVMPAPEKPPDVLSVPLDLASPYHGVLGVRRAAGEITTRDDRLVRSAAVTIAAWLNAVGGRLSHVTERRSGFRSFDQVVDQHATDAFARRHDVSVIVISPSPETRIETVRRWIGRFRSQLRPTDLVGQLASGDVGILLPDTPHDGARTVADRVRRIISAETGFAAQPHAIIRLASRSADSPPTSSLLREVRRQAAFPLQRPTLNADAAPA
jgi:hypothetical protein